MDEGEDSQAGPNKEPDISTPSKGVQQPPKERRNSLSPGSPVGSPGKKAKYTFKVSILTKLQPDWKDLLGTSDVWAYLFGFIHAWHHVCRWVPFRHSGKKLLHKSAEGSAI